MQFKPNYGPFDDALRELEQSLTPKQQERYRGMTGYFADRLRKISKSSKMEQAIEQVEAVQEKCRDDFDDWYDSFQENFTGELDATVDWFNNQRGEGMVTVIGKDGETVRSVIYACNIAGKKTWYAETACVFYEKGQQIKVKLSFHGRCSPIFVVGLTPGHFDAEGWNNLDQDRLAFKCDESGEQINGLFA